MWPGDEIKKYTNNISSLAQHATLLATDGSGGPYASAVLRQVTSAVAVVATHQDLNGNTIVEDVAVQGSQVPGAQTVPRAELHAAIQAAQLAPTGAVVLSDSQYTVQGARHFDPQRLITSSNGDLWEWLAEARVNKTVDIHKVRAHAEADVLAGRLPTVHYLHNSVADAMADSTAEILPPPTTSRRQMSCGPTWLTLLPFAWPTLRRRSSSTDPLQIGT